MNYIYNDEDNQPMHEEHFPPEDRSCKACHAKFWCEKEKNKTDYQTCDESKMIVSWWRMKISGARDRDREDPDEYEDEIEED
jgi:hypothetical protein